MRQRREYPSYLRPVKPQDNQNTEVEQQLPPHGIEVGVKTHSGKTIGIKLRPQDFKIVFDGQGVTRERILGALINTFPQSEAYYKYPDFFPQQWQNQPEKRPFRGIRILTPQYEASGIRAIWLTVADQASTSEDYNFLNQKDPRWIEPVRFNPDCINVQAMVEKQDTETYLHGKQSWYISPYEIPAGLPMLQELQSHAGDFLQYLFPGETISQLSAYHSYSPDTMTEGKARQYANFNEAGHEDTIMFENNQVKRGSAFRPQDDQTFTFQQGNGEYGILTLRPNANNPYYFYTSVKFYEGKELPLRWITPEIERMRRI